MPTGRQQVGEIADVATSVATQLTHLDNTVEEVFSMMMGISCAASDVPLDQTSEITAIVGLAGSLSGAYVVNFTDEAALRITGALMGMPATEIDDMVKDSVGELCNMLAGGWKGRFPELASRCLLSVPMVAIGKDCMVHMKEPLIRIERSYLFESHTMTVSILCES
jgi:chemotaxis protein CheX